MIFTDPLNAFLRVSHCRLHVRTTALWLASVAQLFGARNGIRVSGCLVMLEPYKGLIGLVDRTCLTLFMLYSYMFTITSESSVLVASRHRDTFGTV